jgi:hypothetical protein
MGRVNAADLRSDLRLNDDRVVDGSGNAKFQTGNLNADDLSLFGAST